MIGIGALAPNYKDAQHLVFSLLAHLPLYVMQIIQDIHGTRSISILLSTNITSF